MTHLKNQIIKGTFILSAAGIITRIIGFYYRIFLSRTIGATGMGLYQMIFPVFGLCHSFAIMGIQMSISRFTSIRYSMNDRNGMYTVLKVGLFFSVILSVLSASCVYFFSDFIAIHLLDEVRCGILLRVISFSIPACAVHACICGYYLGQKKASVSAFSQMIEPIVRVGGIYIIAMVLASRGEEPSPVIACIGMIMGEVASTLFSLCFLCTEKKFLFSKLTNVKNTVREMFNMTYPLTLNKLATSFLMAFEAVVIPISLKKSGLSADAAISVYGTLTGMAMPFIMFPSTITGSVSSMVMPSVAEYQSKGDYAHIGSTTSTILKYCLSIGIFCTGYFYIYGTRLGEIFFHSSDAGLFISILAWLCPFMYVNATLTGILNGMGETKVTFINSIISTALRLCFILFIVPLTGIKGCLMGVLAGQILCTLLDIIAVYKRVHFKYDTFAYIIRPLFMTLLSLGISLSFLKLFDKYNFNNALSVILAMVSGGSIFLIYVLAGAKKDI